jgi:hypothetical protein
MKQRRAYGPAGILVAAVLLASVAGSTMAIRLNTLRAEQRAQRQQSLRPSSVAHPLTETGQRVYRTTDLGRTWYLIAVSGAPRRGSEWLGGPRRAR